MPRLSSTRTFLAEPRRNSTQRTPSAYHSNTVTSSRIGITMPPACRQLAFRPRAVSWPWPPISPSRRLALPSALRFLLHIDHAKIRLLHVVLVPFSPPPPQDPQPHHRTRHDQ